MDRCKLALDYHKQGFNCAQSVAAAFADVVGVSVETMLTASTGFGGGVGGSHEELCGAISGGILVLSMLTPRTDGADTASRKKIYQQGREFRSRFQAVFGKTCCGELLAAKPGVTEKTPASARLGVTAHCTNMVVTATEILEQMLAEQEA